MGGAGRPDAVSNPHAHTLPCATDGGPHRNRPDAEHPFGHGKFESVGSLFLALTLVATGLSVGSWSYGKMQHVIIAQNLFGGAPAGTAAGPVVSPGWPALLLAAVSIVSKEWLFQITKKVGDALNSQILVANAWHHRSDAFSSGILIIMSSCHHVIMSSSTSPSS